MRLRAGNLVKHKSGGPIMMVTREARHFPMIGFTPCECTWVENQNKMFADYDEQLLQAVYADGSPRNYDDHRQA